MLRWLCWHGAMAGMFALMPLLAIAHSGAVVYVCSGMIKSENIFEAGSATNLNRQYQVIVHSDAGYVKRDQELAAGCMAQQIEICSCNFGQDSKQDLIHCRSLGLNRNGQEISSDFKLQQQSGIMQFNARNFDPAAGKLIETQGMLQCIAQNN